MGELETERMDGKVIRVSSGIPMVLRVGLAGLAIVMMVLLLWELGPGLWPFNILSLFFGVIVVGGLHVLVALLLIMIAAPDVIWSFRPGFIDVEQRLFGKIDAFSLPTEDLHIEIICHSDTDGPPTWHIVVDAHPPAPIGLHYWYGKLLAYLPRTLRLHTASWNQMRSPGFSTREAADAARRLACSETSA